MPGVGCFYNNLCPPARRQRQRQQLRLARPTASMLRTRIRCVRLDPATGKKLGEFQLPALPGDEGAAALGLPSTSVGRLPRSAAPIRCSIPRSFRPPPKNNGNDSEAARGNKEARSASCSRRSRQATTTLSAASISSSWTATAARCCGRRRARHGFRHNAICIGGGRLYTIDRLSGEQAAKFKLKDEEPPAGRLDRLRPARPARNSGPPTRTSSAPGSAIPPSTTSWSRPAAWRATRCSMSPRGCAPTAARDGKVLWYDKRLRRPGDDPRRHRPARSRAPATC